MKIATTALLTGALLSYNMPLHAQAGTQTNTSVTNSTSAQANRSGAQASSNTAAETSAQAGQGAAHLPNGTSLSAALTQSVDAKKNKPGDPIAAKTTEPAKSGGQVVLPKGTKLVGHVTEAKARGKGESESAVGIVFDKAILKNGQEVPLNTSVQALAAAQSAASTSAGDDDLAAGGGIAGSGASSGRAVGGAVGGVRSTTGGATGAVTNTAARTGGVATGTAGGVNAASNVAGATRGTTGGLNTAGRLTSNSQGVFGLEGINLNSAVSNNSGGSLITSTNKNVHLDSGTQLLLMTRSDASVVASKP
jgi:hypothetical protein